MDVPGKWIDRAGGHRAFDKLILDLNNSVRENYQRRERLGDHRLAQPVRCIAWLGARLIPSQDSAARSMAQELLDSPFDVNPGCIQERDTVVRALTKDQR